MSLVTFEHQDQGRELQSQSFGYAQLGTQWVKKDRNDESLEAYKKSLLGDIKEEALKEDEPAEVEILQVELVCPDRPNGNIMLQFKNHDPAKVRKFTVKEGCVYCMRIHFKVRNDIVFGLKFVNNVYKMLAKGTFKDTQWTKMKIRWVVLLLKSIRTCSTCLGCRLLLGFWLEGTTRVRDWYFICEVVFGQRRDCSLPVRLRNDHRQRLEMIMQHLYLDNQWQFINENDLCLDQLRNPSTNTSLGIYILICFGLEGEWWRQGGNH